MKNLISFMKHLIALIVVVFLVMVSYQVFATKKRRAEWAACKKFQSVVKKCDDNCDGEYALQCFYDCTKYAQCEQ